MIEKHIAKEHLYLLIKSYRFALKCPDSEKANRLKASGLAGEFCDDKVRVSGANLKKWVKAERAPFWAYKAAVEILLTSDYHPRSDEEIAALAYIVLEMRPGMAINELLNILPGGVQTETLGNYLEHFKAATE